MAPLDRRAYLNLAAAITGALSGCSKEDSKGVERNGRMNQNSDSDALTAGDPKRRLVSVTDREIVVPDDYDTIQEAVSEIPLVLQHKWIIKIRHGSYDEHVAIPPFVGSWARPGQSELVPLRITGDQESPANVKVNSLFVTSALGTIPLQLQGMEVQSWNPYDDERTGIGVYGSTEVGLVDIAFADGVNGVNSYNSQVMLRNVNFGSNALSGNAIVVKHSGIAYENNGVDEPTTGNVGGTAYKAQNGHIWFAGSHSTLSGDRYVERDLGFVYDFDQQAWYGPQQLSYDEQQIRKNAIDSTAALIRVSKGDGSSLRTIRSGNRGAKVTLIADQPIRIEQGDGNIRIIESRQLGTDDTITFVYGGNGWLEQ